MPTEARWERTPGGNEVLRGKGYFISYSDNRQRQNVRMERYKIMGTMAGKTTPAEETALVGPHGPDSKFRILCGDYRKEYEAAFADGFAACLQVYERHRTARCDWSTD